VRLFLNRYIAIFFIAMLMLSVGQDSSGSLSSASPSTPYKWGIVSWEMKNFMGKWLHLLGRAMPWSENMSEEEEIARVRQYFERADEINQLEEVLYSQTASDREESGARQLIKELQSLQDRDKARVEERIESLVSKVLVQEGFGGPFGLLWPPVDMELVLPPTVLVTSPRDAIKRQGNVTLRPDVSLDQREALEHEILKSRGLSALVVDIGGIATYPSIVPPNGGLRHALSTAVHEWLHQYWFFRPLGMNYGRDSDTTSLNESAANLAGREIGDKVYEIITGKTLTKPVILSDGQLQEVVKILEIFDFRGEMQTTRLEVEELLALGEIETAERIMEERRLLFLDNGYYIRKLNQAYFAFHGAYAQSAASVSTVDEELEAFRAAVSSPGQFVRDLAKFSSYQEFKNEFVSIEAACRGC